MRELQTMWAERFDEHCEFVLYFVKYYLPDRMVEGIQRFQTLSVLDSSLISIQ